MRRADAHLHLFRGGYASRYGQPWARKDDVEVYDALRQAHSIERGLVVGFEGLPAFEGNNADLKEWHSTHPWMAPLAYVDTRRPTELSAIEGWASEGFYGISIYALEDRDVDCVDGWGDALITVLNETKAIVSVNVPSERVDRLRGLFESLSGCDVLISHLGLPGAHREVPSRGRVRERIAGVLGMADLAHVGVKISGLYAVSEPSHDYPHPSAWPFISELSAAFGDERLYWGSDFPPCLEHVSFAQAVDVLDRSGWSQESIERVVGGNLLRILARGGMSLADGR